jgi:hypothetical protein
LLFYFGTGIDKFIYGSSLMNHAAIIEEDTMEKPKSADGVSGMLLKTMDGKFIFRVYNFYDFKDYTIEHSDLNITINDPDAYFYMDSVLDHSPATLGITEDKE